MILIFLKVNHHRGCKLQVNLIEYKAIGVLYTKHNCFTKYQRKNKYDLTLNCLRIDKH